MQVSAAFSHSGRFFPRYTFLHCSAFASHTSLAAVPPHWLSAASAPHWAGSTNRSFRGSKGTGMKGGGDSGARARTPARDMVAVQKRLRRRLQVSSLQVWTSAGNSRTRAIRQEFPNFIQLNALERLTLCLRHRHPRPRCHFFALLSPRSLAPFPCSFSRPFFTHFKAP